MKALLEGVIMGLTLAILLGPAFFTIIQTSIHRGFKSGMILSLGVFLSDVTLVALSYLGAAQILQDKANHLYFGVIGGIVLVSFGFYTFTRKVTDTQGDEGLIEKKPRTITFILKGFFLNLANPFLWIFWMGVMVAVSSSYGIHDRNVILFFSGLLGTILLTDFLKSFIANQIKSYMTPRILTTINRVVGVFLMVFGVVLIVRVLMGVLG